MTAAPLDPDDLARIRRNAMNRLPARVAGWEVSLVERDRDRLLAEVDRLAADLATAQAKVRRVEAVVAEASVSEGPYRNIIHAVSIRAALSGEGA